MGVWGVLSPLPQLLTGRVGKHHGYFQKRGGPLKKVNDFLGLRTEFRPEQVDDATYKLRLKKEVRFLFFMFL